MYTVNGKDIYYHDFIDVLKKAGIEKGDIIFVHSDISVFGKLATQDTDFLLNCLVDALKESVGPEGTVVMPTFTYSFCKNEIYNVISSKSIVGVLTEFFRKKEEITRSMHPIFSVAVWGKHKKELLELGKDSFDKDSVFGKLHKINGKIVFLGAPFQSCTFIHHIEQMHGVPYRHIKHFKGKIQTKTVEHEDECTYLVRHLDKNVNTLLSKLENHLLTKGIMKEKMLGNGRILVVNTGALFAEGYRLLDKNIYFFLEEVPN